MSATSSVAAASDAAAAHAQHNASSDRTSPATPSSAPVDDGAAKHLIGHPLPSLTYLPSTEGGEIDLFNVSLRRPVLVFVYPRILPVHSTSGAKGSSSASLLSSVRDKMAELRRHEPDLAAYGLSTETAVEQKEAVQRLGLPFALLSDPGLSWAKPLDLPLFQSEGKNWLKSITLLLRGGQVTRVNYPVWPPESAATTAIPMLVPDEQLAPEATG